MSWDKFKETGSVENPDNPSTNDWIGDIDTDFVDSKIDEYEKMKVKTKNGDSTEQDSTAIKNLFDRYSDADIEMLDENTIDTDFVPKARNADGSDPCPKIKDNDKDKNRDAWYKHSPLASQQDSDGEFISEGFKVGNVEGGTVLYQLGKQDSAGEWFTDYATVDSCRDPNTGKVDLSKLKEKLQIKDDKNEKNTLRAFKVDSPGGIKVAEGYALENQQYGSGGGRQIFISPTHRILSEIMDEDK